VGCQTCTSASNCSACQLGYSLVNNLCVSSLPYPCASMSSTSTCSACLQGYTLSVSTCVLSLSCNADSSCTGCPYGYYLINSTCQSCPSLPNCLSCNSNNGCNLCSTGYFLNSAACSACNSNCLDCSSLTYCNQAASGYYLDINNDGSFSGKVYSCNSPCLTCQYNSNYCLTCISGYTISGSVCFSNAKIVIQIILGPGTTSSSIFFSSDSTATQLAKALTNVNRLLASLCSLLPAAFKKNDPLCQNILRITSMATGSIAVGMELSADGMTDSGSTETLVSSSLSVGIDGASIISSSVTSQDIPSSS